MSANDELPPNNPPPDPISPPPQTSPPQSPVRLQFYTNETGWTTLDPNVPLSQQPLASSWFSQSQPSPNDSGGYRVMYVESAAFQNTGKPMQRGIMFGTGEPPQFPTMPPIGVPNMFQPQRPFSPPGFPSPMINPWASGGFSNPTTIPSFPLFLFDRGQGGSTDDQTTAPNFFNVPPFSSSMNANDPFGSTSQTPADASVHHLHEQISKKPDNTEQRNAPPTYNNQSNISVLPPMVYCEPAGCACNFVPCFQPISFWTTTQRNSSRLHSVRRARFPSKGKKFVPRFISAETNSQNSTNRAHSTLHLVEQNPTYKDLKPSARRRGHSVKNRPTNVDLSVERQTDYVYTPAKDLFAGETVPGCSKPQFVFKEHERFDQIQPTSAHPASANMTERTTKTYDSCRCMDRAKTGPVYSTDALPPPPCQCCKCVEMMNKEYWDSYKISTIRKTPHSRFIKQTADYLKSHEPVLSDVTWFPTTDLNATHTIETLDTPVEHLRLRQLWNQRLSTETDSSDSILTAFVKTASKKLDIELERINADVKPVG
ncbi:hypothetical protein EG68_10976 [Paragonimus skrjabini miyazakii]|uniref:Uncharacterized protein n=1 Tax=Paragonimus skrjabini miyazakii TaxID=59628 RepID=A0A8S9YF64_9TREM|nr:hypothetical protein EG68_10976 [Paragonimus skrjabini miyazakii]